MQYSATRGERDRERVGQLANFGAYTNDNLSLLSVCKLKPHIEDLLDVLQMSRFLRSFLFRMSSFGVH